MPQYWASETGVVCWYYVWHSLKVCFEAVYILGRENLVIKVLSVQALKWVKGSTKLSQICKFFPSASCSHSYWIGNYQFVSPGRQVRKKKLLWSL